MSLSNEEILVCGVTQGSVLEPLLLPSYINDLKKTSSLINFVLFADDIFINGKSLDETILVLNKELDKISTWCHCSHSDQLT